MESSFEPRQYPSYETLPADTRPFFIPVDEGFVPVNAIHSPIEAWDAAYVDKNILKLDLIIHDKTAESVALLDTFDGKGPLTLLNEAAKKHTAIERMQKQAELDVLPRRSQQLSGFIVSRGITTEIDKIFVEDMIAAFETIELLQQGLSAIDSYVESALAALQARIDAAELVKSQEETINVPISQDREIKVVTDRKASSLRLDLPLVTDPREIQVKTGPNAVHEVLGAQLTDDDYAALSGALLGIDGPVGDSLHEYESAVESWIIAIKSDSHIQAKVDERFYASMPVRKACNHDWLFTGIVLDSIFITAVRRHPDLNHIPTPQPFSS